MNRIIIPAICLIFLLVSCKKDYIRDNKFNKMQTTGIEDIDNPILVEKFNFFEANFSQTFNISFKKMGNYEIGILDLKESIPQDFIFRGKVNIEILSGNNLLFKQIIDSTDVGIYANKEMTLYKRLTFMRFYIPFKDEYLDLGLKLTVIKPDEQFLSFDDLFLYLSASSSP